MRIFLDANILFSAAKSDGAVRQLLQLLLADGHGLVADAFVLEEARRNLARKASATSLDALDKLQTVVELAPTAAMRDDDGEWLQWLQWLQWLPAKDRPVLAAAARSGCDRLITGDRTHFGEAYGRSFNGVLILSPAMAATELR